MPIIGILLESQKVKFPINLYSLIILVFVFVLFRGLRWNTGTDWDQFYLCFENANWSNIFSYYRYDDLDEKMEPGYMLLNVIIKYFGDYTLFLILTNLFIVGSWAYFSYRIMPFRANMIFAMIMATNLIFPIRLQLAACIIAWSLFLLSRKRFILPLGLSILAYTIHKSALFLIPIIVLLRIKQHIGGKSAVIVTFVSFVGDYFAAYIPLLILFITPYLPENIQGNILTYSDCELDWGISKSFISMAMGMGLNIVMVFLFIYARNLFTEKERNFKYVFDVYFTSYILWTFFFRFFSSPALEHFTRISEYFSLGFPVCFTISFFMLEYRKNVSGKITNFIFILYYLYKINSLISSTPFPHAFFPYKSIFS